MEHLFQSYLESVVNVYKKVKGQHSPSFKQVVQFIQQFLTRYRLGNYQTNNPQNLATSAYLRLNASCRIVLGPRQTYRKQRNFTFE